VLIITVQTEQEERRKLEAVVRQLRKDAMPQRSQVLRTVSAQ
jgi:hypothetical protein